MKINEQYKILGAIYALRNFNVKSLVSFANVGESTVYRFLKGNRDLFLEVGTKKTNSPGGQHKQYALKTEMLPRVKQLLEEQYLDSLSALSHHQTTNKTISAIDSLSFLATNDILYRLYPEAKSIADKKALLKAASISSESARLELGVQKECSGTRLSPQQNENYLALEQQQGKLQLEELKLSWRAHGADIQNLMNTIDPILNKLGNPGNIWAQFLNRTPVEAFQSFRVRVAPVVWVTDGIETKTDRLTPIIHKEVKGAFHGHINYFQAHEFRPQALDISEVPSVCVLTMNSEGSKKTKSALINVINYCVDANIEKVIVFDAKSGKTLRKNTPRSNLIYFDNCNNITNKVISGIIKTIVVSFRRRNLQSLESGNLGTSPAIRAYEERLEESEEWTHSLIEDTK